MTVGQLATQFLIAVVPITLGGVGWLIKNRRPRAVKAAEETKAAADARKTDAEAAAITARTTLEGVQYQQKQQADLIDDLYKQIRETRVLVVDADERVRTAERRADRAERRIDVLEQALRDRNIPIPP